MTDVSPALAAATFAKTAAGIQEIQSRGLGLPPLTRRLLVLVDGKRSGKELAAFAAGHDVADILGQLLAQGCIEALAAAEAAPVAAPAGAADLSSLPQASARSAKDIEMARNFMTNTINTMFGQNMRLTLIEAIFTARTADDLRRVYPVWAEAMASIGVGAKRLPELRLKLFQVL